MNQTKQEISKNKSLKVSDIERNKAKILEKYLHEHHVIREHDIVSIDKHESEGKNYLFYMFYPYTTFGWHDMRQLQDLGFGFVNLSVATGTARIAMDLEDRDYLNDE